MILALLVGCGPTIVEVSAPPPAPVDVRRVEPATVQGVDPLDGRTLAEVCGSVELSLIKWDYDVLHRDFAATCCVSGGLDEGQAECELDWPFSDVPPCAEYDLIRNGIMARYGYPFTKPEWQRTFEDQEWYRRREDFDGDWLSGAARRNVQKLIELREGRVGCM